MEIASKPYAAWLEEAVRDIVSADPKKIAIAFRSGDGDDEGVSTKYYGCNIEDIAVFAHYLNTDAMMGTVFANADRIVQTAEDMEDSI